MSRALVTGDISIPATAAHLVEDNLGNTKAVVDALSDFDQRSWHSFCEEPLRTARTAVAYLPNRDNAVLVFGLRINEQETGAALLAEARVVGVYCRTDDEVVFGHLDPTLDQLDYLLPIPASDEAFESGAAVATATESHKAALRSETFRAAMLGKQQNDEQPVHQLVVPVLVGAGEFR